MSIEFNHTIVPVRDRHAAAREIAETLGLPEPGSYGPFAVLELDNGASLDFMDNDSDFPAMHYAFLVDEEAFDQIHARIRDSGRTWWADPFGKQPGEINNGDGGRGLYWDGPDGHKLEIITRPYGSG